jgi:hypothetical protein
MDIDMKAAYLEVFQEVPKFPETSNKRGKYIWWALGPIYWALAFIVNAAVPNSTVFRTSPAPF